jgi:hypothetical protein
MALLGDGLASGGVAFMMSSMGQLLSTKGTISRALTIAGSDSGAGAGIKEVTA